MGVFEGGLRAGVAKQAPDREDGLTLSERGAGVRVALVVKPHVLDADLSSNPVPEPETVATRPRAVDGPPRGDATARPGGGEPGYGVRALRGMIAGIAWLWTGKVTRTREVLEPIQEI